MSAVAVAGRVPSASERMWRFIEPEPNSGCWLWTGCRTRFGYGRFVAGGKTLNAHRVVYELEAGPIVAGLTLDHLCRNTSCVNPAHMEPVPAGVNAMRGTNPAALNARRDVCLYGHRFDEDNTRYTTTGNRRCRRCTNDLARRQRARSGLRGPRRGEAKPNARLTAEQVAAIRRRWADGRGRRGWGMRCLAREYGVAYSTVFALLHGLSWQGSGGG